MIVDWGIWKTDGEFVPKPTGENADRTTSWPNKRSREEPASGKPKFSTPLEIDAGAAWNGFSVCSETEEARPKTNRDEPLARSTIPALGEFALHTQSASQLLALGTQSASEQPALDALSVSEQLALGTRSAPKQPVLGIQSAPERFDFGMQSVPKRLIPGITPAPELLIFDTHPAPKRFAFVTGSASERITPSTMPALSAANHPEGPAWELPFGPVPDAERRASSKPEILLRRHKETLCHGTENLISGLTRPSPQPQYQPTEKVVLPCDPERFTPPAEEDTTSGGLSIGVAAKRPVRAEESGNAAAFLLQRPPLNLNTGPSRPTAPAPIFNPGATTFNPGATTFNPGATTFNPRGKYQFPAQTAPRSCSTSLGNNARDKVSSYPPVTREEVTTNYRNCGMVVFIDGDNVPGWIAEIEYVISSENHLVKAVAFCGMHVGGVARRYSDRRWLRIVASGNGKNAADICMGYHYGLFDASLPSSTVFVVMTKDGFGGELVVSGAPGRVQILGATGAGHVGIWLIARLAGGVGVGPFLPLPEAARESLRELFWYGGCAAPGCTMFGLMKTLPPSHLRRAARVLGVVLGDVLPEHDPPTPTQTELAALFAKNWKSDPCDFCLRYGLNVKTFKAWLTGNKCDTCSEGVRTYLTEIGKLSRPMETGPTD